MYLLSSISFLAILFSLFLDASGCKAVAEQGSLSIPQCVDRNFTYIQIDGHPVPAGSKDVRIQLKKPSTFVLVTCKRSQEGIRLHWERITWNNKVANQVRAHYIKGEIVMRVFWCDSFDGPKKAGIHCAIEAFASACPGQVGIDNHTCVYEVQTTRFSGNTVRKASEVKTEVAVTVREIANVAVGVSHTKERTVVNTYKVNSRSYIVIPAGYTFCSYSLVKSIEEYLAPTGFKWQCDFPKFVQTKRIGRCSGKPLCENQAPCPGFNNQFPNGENKSVVLQPVAMLIVLCMIVLNI